MDKKNGYLLVEQKVEDFSKNEKQYLAKTFQETEARTRFIDPFFQALGWDFDQTNVSKHLWDVHREYSQRDNSNTKKPDYAFNINGKLKFFVEAKAPWVPLTDRAPVFQAKRYAYSTNGKAPVVIITDFQEFRVYNAIERPVYDNPLQGLIKDFDLKYTDYIKKWDFIYSNFSKEAVMSGSIEKLLGKITKETKTLDKEFLSDLIGFREILARNIAIRNKDLDVDTINECVQRILDRIIFIRNLEDREIENEILFKVSESREDVYKNLLPIFSKLNDDYNGLLFKPDVSDKIIVDDDVIKNLIKNLYPPHSPFQFDIIEPEILGRIYEKFLGSKIRLTESHQAKVEEKPEVRHAGGVFYTPQFIVENIVSNTVGKILNPPAPFNKGGLEGMTPEDIGKIKILDPACGSGSFLLGAFDYLIKYHESWYASAPLTIRKKYKDDFFETPDKEIRLTIKKKSEILKNNIFGVDIDREATEVAIMSLYLKLLDQGFDKGQGFLFLKGHILPEMTENIKCGNSLISRDELFQFDLFGDESINPFDWEKEFQKILCKEQISKFHHITFETKYSRISNGNEAVMLNSEEAAIIAECFRETKEKLKFKIIACSMLVDHIHLVIADMGNEISNIVNHLKGYSSFILNRTLKGSVEGEGRQMHLWSKSFSDTYLEDENHLFNAIEYVNNNHLKHENKSIDDSDEKATAPLRVQLLMNSFVEPFTKWEDYEYNAGGFDVIIGNPPYIRIQEMQSWAEKSVEIYKKIYESGKKGNFDIYVLFIEKSLSLLNQSGLFGMILPNKFFMADYGETIRGLINKNIFQIVNFGDQQIFDNATTYTNLLFLSKEKQNNFKYVKIKHLVTEGLSPLLQGLNEYKDENIEIGIVENKSLTNDTWQFSFGEDKKFFEKLLKIKITLDEITDKILVGLQTSADPVYILEFKEEKDKTLLLYSKEIDENIEIEKEILRPLLKGKEIRRYSSPEIFYWLIFPYSIINNEAVLFEKKYIETTYPLCWDYLNRNKERLEKRDVSGDKNFWWQYGRNQNIIEMNKPKLITQVLASRASYTADLEGKYCFVGGGNAGGYGIKLKPEYEKHYHYLLGILNSSPIDKYLRYISTQFRGGFYSYAKRFIEKLPIYIPDSNDKDKYEKCNKIEEMVKQILEINSNRALKGAVTVARSKDAEFLEGKIDELVEEIYEI